MKALVAVAALLATGWASGCCTTGSERAPAPPASPVDPRAALDPRCLGLCERLATCDRDEGREGRVDCTIACAEGGVYASVGAEGWACAERPSCDGTRTCAGPGLAVALLGSIASASPTSAPAEWPADFPTITGGVPRPAPAMGPVRVGLLAYPGRDVASTDTAFRDALVAAGWTIDDAPPSEEAHRFAASRGEASVSVSIYRDGSDTIVQTMQLSAPAP